MTEPKQPLGKDEIENIFSEKIKETKIKILESRQNFLLWFGGALLAIFGVMTPMWTTGRNTERVDKSIESMEKRFEELVGKQLRKPIIECLYQNTRLDGQLVDCFPRESNAIPGIIIQNEGNGIVFHMDIHLYLKFKTLPSDFNMSWWHRLDHCEEPDFDMAFEYQHTITYVHPQESLGLKLGQWSPVEKGQKVKALMKIYYGEPEPLRVNWSINVIESGKN